MNKILFDLQKKSTNAISTECTDAPSRVLLTIILVNYKTPEYTIPCLRSIYQFRPRFSFEVIVVDNGSNDELENWILKHFPKVRFLESGGNIGFARANNLGIHNSHGEYILLLNNDSKVTPGLIESLFEHIRQHPEAGVVGPRHIDARGFYQPSCGQFPNFFNEIIRKMVHYRLSVDDYRVRDYIDQVNSGRREVDWVSGSCMMVRREVFYQIGLLDERFFMYFEDIDFCRRVREQSWQVHYLSAWDLVHYGGASAKKNLLFALIENRRSQRYFIRKYFGFLNALLMRIVVSLKYGFNLIKWSCVFGFKKILGFNDRKSYTMALLSKKVMFIALSNVNPKPEEPKLQHHRVSSKVEF